MIVAQDYIGMLDVLSAMWIAAGKPVPWHVPLQLHQDYEMALMGVQGRFKSLRLKTASCDTWMEIEKVSADMRLPEGF